MFGNGGIGNPWDRESLENGNLPARSLTTSMVCAATAWLARAMGGAAWPVGLAPLSGPAATAGLALAALALLGIASVHLMRLYAARSRLLEKLEIELAERKKAEEALRESEGFYHSLVESLPQTILRKDLEGRFTFVSAKFSHELGKPFEEILGKTDFDFFPPELAEKYRRDDRRVIQTGEILDTVEEHVTPQGERLYVQVVKTPLYAPDGQVIGMQGIFWDVTSRMQAEEQLRLQNLRLQEMARSEHEAHQELKLAQSRLVQQEKLASLGLLVAGVAHEINNPLSFVTNNLAVLDRDLGDVLRLLEMLQQSNGSDPAGAIRAFREEADIDYTVKNLPNLIQRTREGLRRIQQIVSDLRVFARLDEGDLSEVDLNAGIESTVTIALGHAKKKGIRLETDLQPLPLVSCYAAKINQVVLNLLTNAIDACQEGGKVTVRSRPEPGGARIEVCDTGCGISPEVRERIFDPFFTTKPVGQGTGLGLSISYAIVADHGGTIDVESEPGQETRFTIHLPQHPPAGRRAGRETIPAAGTGAAT
jgi:two-component system NtrC family sensor kinase